MIAALALGGLLTLGTALNAQDATPAPPAATPPAGALPGGGHGRPLTIAQLTLQLALTDEQKTNVQAVLLDQRKQTRDVRNDTTLSTADRHAKLKTIADAANAKLQTILTPDQYAKYLKLLPARPAAAPPQGAPPAAASAAN